MREVGRSIATAARPLLRAGASGALLAVLALGTLPARAAESSTEPVTAPTGASLIAKLKTGVDWTTFGRAGEGQEASATLGAKPAGSSWLRDGFELTGADLYRLDCRSCHGPDAKGSRSGIPPLQDAFARSGDTKAGPDEGELRVRHRLLTGGNVMPPFNHLTSQEVNVLLGYLHWLANGAKGTPPSAQVHQPADRVGEHIVKSTCQVCHDAVSGPWRQPVDQQTVVPLTQMTELLSVKQFVRKVRTGSPVAGNPHGRMPRLGYLSPQELEAAYVYLTAYPPKAE